MGSEPSKNLRSHKTAAIFFLVGGLLFIIVAVISSKIFFLPVGIALVIISIVFWQHGKKLTDGINKKEN